MWGVVGGKPPRLPRQPTSGGTESVLDPYGLRTSARHRIRMWVVGGKPPACHVSLPLRYGIRSEAVPL